MCSSFQSDPAVPSGPSSRRATRRSYAPSEPATARTASLTSGCRIVIVKSASCSARMLSPSPERTSATAFLVAESGTAARRARSNAVVPPASWTSSCALRSAHSCSKRAVAAGCVGRSRTRKGMPPSLRRHKREAADSRSGASASSGCPASSALLSLTSPSNARTRSWLPSSPLLFTALANLASRCAASRSALSAAAASAEMPHFWETTLRPSSGGSSSTVW
mmetsp:Transcript_33680/g.111399  ORF Transcript_33680/g.111399 Transcript_33680/m.111399 type:complete len:222 (+) Transcript_33680:1196-1861(+)